MTLPPSHASPSSSSKGGSPHTARAPGDARKRPPAPAFYRWLLANTFAPPWLKGPLSHPLVGYLAAIVLQVLAIFITLLLSRAFPGFTHPTALSLLVITLVALWWGAAPSILSTLVGAVLVNYVLIPPRAFTWSVNLTDLVGFVVICLVGASISRLASQSERGRRQAESLANSLAQEQARLEATFEAIPDILSIHDAQGALVQMNAAGQQLFRPLNQPIAIENLPAVYSLLTKEGVPLSVDHLPVSRALRGETVSGIELRASDAQGRVHFFLTGAAPIRNATGQIEGSIVIAHDITALRLAEQEATRQTRQLQAFQRLTDTALTHLTPEEVLPEILERLREVMQVDNAAILLMSEDGTALNLRAANGLEEKAIGRVRVPLGAGFAGRIASRRAPFVVDDLRTFDVYNPLLHERLRSAVGVPLLIQERVLGVVHVGTTGPRHFTSEEIALLQRAADRLALALDRARLYAESEARATELEAIIETITDGVFVYNATGHLKRINHAGLALLKRYQSVNDPSLPIKERAAQIVAFDEHGKQLPPEQFPSYRVMQGEILAGPTNADLMVYTLDGDALHLNISGAPIRSAESKQVGGVVVARDVTGRRQLEQRTQESLEALLLMAEALVGEHEAGPLAESNTPAFLTEHPDSRGEAVARRLAELTCRVLGCQRISIAVRDGTTDVLHPLAVVGLLPEQEAQWWARQRQQEVRFQESWSPDLVARLEAGETLVLDFTQPPYCHQPNPYSIQTILVVPLRLQQQIIGLMALDHGGDAHIYTPEELRLAGAVAKLAAMVIERERLMTERSQQQARFLALQETTRRMDEFLSIASHEMRTPITSIKANMQLLLRRVERAAAQTATPHTSQLPQQQIEILRRTERQIQRLTRLLDDLIDLSRIRAGKMEFNLALTDLRAIITDIVEGEQLALPERSITLNMPENLTILVMADPDRIGQVILNYLTNAIKYSPSHQPIAVCLRIEEQTARVSVRDQGPGIPPAEQNHVWEVFHRVPGIEVQSGSGIGLGLGLHISKTIVERHHGQVGVESVPGHGATFWFTLPLADEQ